jgi:hypothetical protein
MFFPDYPTTAEFEQDVDKLFDAIDELASWDDADVDHLVAVTTGVKQQVDHILFKLTGSL